MSDGRPVKVVFTMPFGERQGGSERVLWMFLRHVDRARVEPFVIFHAPGGLVDEVRAMGIGTAVVPTGRFRQGHRMAAAIWRMASIMRRERPDVVAHWLNRGQVYGAPAAVLAGLRGRTMWFQRHLVDGTDPLDRMATRLPALAVGTPSRRAAAAQARCLRPSRPTFWVHNGIPQPPPADPDALVALRARHAIPPGRLLVGIVARLQRWKGQDRFLRAVALVRRQGFDVHALVVGGTPYDVEVEFSSELEALAAELGIAEHVTFTGQVSDAAAYHQILDVEVNASDEESFGLVLLEAMALGTPVVAVDHGGPAEILDDRRTGVLVPRAEPESLAEGIAWLLADEDRRAAVVQAARAEVRERFSAERMVDELAVCFEALSAGRVPG